MRSLVTSIATADAVASHEEISQHEIDSFLRRFRNFDSDGVGVLLLMMLLLMLLLLRLMTMMPFTA